MRGTKLEVALPDHVLDVLIEAEVDDSLRELASPAGLDLVLRNGSSEAGATGDCPSSAVDRAAGAIRRILQFVGKREDAVTSLADALMTGYEELNLFYGLLPRMATGVDPREIAEVLVAEAARTLNCRRVSLLMLDEEKSAYRVLASRGLPEAVTSLVLPVRNSIAGRTLSDEDLLLVNDLRDRPDLARLSRGEYESEAFAVVRVPLRARGEALGFLTATERAPRAEFTARDCKLLEALSAMGASALMSCQLHAAVNRQMMSTIHALASAVDAKDHYTHDHAGRVADLCVATAEELGLTDPRALREVRLGALLHDIGKIGIPDAILSKPSGLTAEEYKIVRRHVHIGASIVAHVPGLERVAEAIRHHHERFDGLGYPAGLCGEAVPLTAGLIAVADTYDSLTSDRPYRSATSTAEAVRELRRHAGTQFNPRVVDAFVAIVERNETPAVEYPVSPQPAG